MSFAFTFADDELDEEYFQGSSNGTESMASDGQSAAAAQEPASAKEGVCKELSLRELLEALPPRLSHSPLRIGLDNHPSSSSANGSSSTTRPRSATIVRRDLFDARFQMLLDDEDSADEDEDEDEVRNKRKQDERAPALVGATTDLIPGVYEGGLKTWECALDLVAALDAHSSSLPQSVPPSEDESWEWLRGKSMLELGCGTAIPSLFLFQRLLSLPVENRDEDAKTRLHLCDFNAQVLKLVTLPNFILAWYFSPASLPHRIAHPPRTARITSAPSTTDALPSSTTETEAEAESGTEVSNLTEPSTTTIETPGDLRLSSELFSAFESSLLERGIELRFFAGSWDGFDPPCALALGAGQHEERSGAVRKCYDLVMSAETIYEPSNLESLLRVLRLACASTNPNADSGSLANALERTSLDPAPSSQLSEPQTETQTSNEQEIGNGNGSKSKSASASKNATLCLIAAKVLYFGVGGGVEAFRAAVGASGKFEGAPDGKESTRGWTEIVRRVREGVGRVVLSVGWTA